jgi:hypothetical protein
VESMWGHARRHTTLTLRGWILVLQLCYSCEDDELGVTVMMWTLVSCVVPATNRYHIFGGENMVVTCVTLV